MPLSKVPQSLHEDGSVGTAQLIDQAVTPSKLAQPYTQDTAQAATSGTSKNFAIPTWARRVTVMLDGVSLNAATDILIQIGTASGIEAAGYVGTSSLVAAAVVTTGLSSGWRLFDNSAAASNVMSGALVLTKMAGDTWIATGMFGDSSEVATRITAGSKTLAGALTQVRVTSVTGTAAFDAGSINVSYE